MFFHFSSSNYKKKKSLFLIDFELIFFGISENNEIQDGEPKMAD